MRALLLLLLPLAAAAADDGWPGWRPGLLPNQTLPATRFHAEPGGVLRVEAEGSYGNRVKEMPGAGRFLAWRWRLDQPLAAPDLRRKEGDDAALKVCAMYDLPLDALPFWERQKMRLARSLSGEALPAATLCYVWDPTLPAGTLLPNAYTPRLRWIVLRGQGEALGAWQEERRDLRADFLRAFGDEAREPPPLVALAVGADADNTGGRSSGRVTEPKLQP
ncbi:MAG: hypothetical protein Fur0014_11600 [Rubrivivax sp.]